MHQLHSVDLCIADNLHNLLYVCCISYLDDIIVFGETPEQLMDNLDRVFTRLKEKGLKAKPSKCVLFRSPIDFLGHMVSADGIQPQPDKLAAIRDWSTPHCLRDVRAFCGLASYYRKFVKDFAKIAEPLSRMTKKTHHSCGPMRLNSRLKNSRKPCWMSIPSRIRPQGFRVFWTLMPQMLRSERCSARCLMESKSQLPMSPAFSTAHKETTAPRGENSSQSSRRSNISDTTCWATKSSSSPQSRVAPDFQATRKNLGKMDRNASRV